MQNLTTQRHSKKVFRTVKCCLSKEFIQQTTNSSAVVKYCKKIKLLDRKELLTPKATQKAQVLPPTVTHNHTLPNIKQIIQNHWSILKTNKVLEKTFSIEAIIAFRESKTLKQLIGRNTIQSDKNIKKSKQQI